MFDRRYRVVAAYDTETNNVGEGDGTRAYVVCYQVNDLRNIDIETYEAGRDDDVRIYRTLAEIEAYLDSLIEWGAGKGIVPIVCAYNLMFDLASLTRWVDAHGAEVNAQSSTNVYTLDVLGVDGEPCLRFWDCYHLELSGLRVMGDVAGLPKLDGDWDYDRQRTPSTPLTDEEIGYATRDVQVIPAYLRYLLESNEWMTPDMLGVRVLTKSSIVRQMARHDIGTRAFTKANGKKMKLLRAFELTCWQEHAKDFDTYSLRKACFRGGLTFTAGVNASKPLPNVCSLDVVSMHHLFINGRYQPVHFKECEPEWLQVMTERILEYDPDEVLGHYEHPFEFGLNVVVRFSGLRLKTGSAFERYCIATLAVAKFDRTGVMDGSDVCSNESMAEAARTVYDAGYHDFVDGRCTVAFGKVIQADVATVHLTEVEVYVMGRVYEWDSMEVLGGERTMKFTAPPDYVTLQSNMMFAQKQDMKRILHNYNEGVPYPLDIPASIPEGIAAQLRTGELQGDFAESYYQSCKAKLNGIYGTMAQDVMKPGYMWNGGVEVDPSTRLTRENYAERIPRSIRVWYQYGTRIVGGSRLHLVLAIERLFESFGDSIEFLGGDTDSLKISLSNSVTPDDLVDALRPIHEAADRAISGGMRRARANFGEMCADLHRVGHFDIEPATPSDVCYRWGMEAWNKCRIMFDGERNHVTMAGVSRPRGTMNIETFADALHDQGVPFEKYAQLLLGYDMHIPPDLTHALEKHEPEVDWYDGEVTDWLGVTRTVHSPECIALYPCGRVIGDLLKPTNDRNVRYIRSLGREVDENLKQIRYDGRAIIESDFWSVT